MSILKSREDYVKKVISAMEKDNLDWKKGFISRAKHHNPITGTVYSSFNALRLNIESHEKGYHDPRWITFSQAQKKGLVLKKGSKASRIEFWKDVPSQIKELENSQGKPFTEEERKELKEKLHPICAIHTVFNGSQFENLQPWIKQDLKEPERDQLMEEIIKNSEAKIEFSSTNSNYYHPSSDKIVIVQRELWESKEHMYGTIMHEIAHSTGAESRLNRNLQSILADKEAYAKEELVAELTSGIVNHKYNLTNEQTIDNSAAYLKSWIKIIKDNPHALFQAYKEAEKAHQYIQDKMLYKEIEKNPNYIAITNGKNFNINQLDVLKEAVLTQPEKAKIIAKEYIPSSDMRLLLNNGANQSIDEFKNLVDKTILEYKLTSSEEKSLANFKELSPKELLQAKKEILKQRGSDESKFLHQYEQTEQIRNKEKETKLQSDTKKNKFVPKISPNAFVVPKREVNPEITMQKLALVILSTKIAEIKEERSRSSEIKDIQKKQIEFLTSIRSSYSQKYTMYIPESFVSRAEGKREINTTDRLAYEGVKNFTNGMHAALKNSNEQQRKLAIDALKTGSISTKTALYAMKNQLNIKDTKRYFSKNEIEYTGRIKDN